MLIPFTLSQRATATRLQQRYLSDLSIIASCMGISAGEMAPDCEGFIVPDPPQAQMKPNGALKPRSEVVITKEELLEGLSQQ